MSQSAVHVFVVADHRRPLTGEDVAARKPLICASDAQDLKSVCGDRKGSKR